jgi:hypothetical protein
MARDDTIETIAREFHDAYERLAHDHDYVTREASRAGWALIPENNRNLMMATVRSLLTDEIIEPGRNAM